MKKSRLAAPRTPDRFRTSARTLFIDRFMTRFIKVGGVSLIAAVFAIFVFIFWQILPLFQGAKVEPLKSIQLPGGDYKAIGLDEWAQMPFTLDGRGQIQFIAVDGKTAPQKADMAFIGDKSVTTFRYKPDRQGVIYGTTDGMFAIASIDLSADFASRIRLVSPKVTASPFYEIGEARDPVLMADYGDNGTETLIASVKGSPGNLSYSVATLSQARTLFGAGEKTLGRSYDLTPFLSGVDPQNILVDAAAEAVVVTSKAGEVFYFRKSDGEITLRQTFKPFGDLPDPSIASSGYLFGDVSLVLTSAQGFNRVFSLYSPKGHGERVFGQTKEFHALPGYPAYFSSSLRNKAFLSGTGNRASLRYFTTGDVRWEKDLPFRATHAAIGRKYDRLVFLDATHKLHLFKLNDPHPEASFAAFFKKLWYEGASEPKYEWQSTGGSDEFEPKLSLIPLIIGTLKGTFYAMVFAVPIALLAAIYTSQFLSARIRSIAKPTMEIMASLPSVVLGFLAALWLAPAIETRIPAILLVVILLPIAAFGTGTVAGNLPLSFKKIIRPGLEFIYLLPVFALVFWIAMAAGPWVEKILFVATDPQTGQRVADFRLWWPQVTHTPFEQRNSLAVGFIMGFAVIPIIFTITEDSLSNVPHFLRSGSLALGASRWQTAMYVVLPTASAGIFSALMIGLGRAIGETMIVVMATGNTPIMDFNIFSGMRTLSANIAVELPEAPHHGTLYRTLFLGAMVLFLATFFVNTIAEIMRQRLREKYKTV